MATTGKAVQPKNEVATPGELALTDAVNRSLVMSPETRALFLPMVMMVPESEGDGADRIVMAILGAKSWDELSDPWNSEKADSLNGVDIAIHTITRHVSSYAEGLGVFLVCHGRRQDTDEEFVFSTGSVSTVAQLVRAYALRAFPLWGRLVKSDRPTARGYYPMHLDIVASSAGPADAS